MSGYDWGVYILLRFTLKDGRIFSKKHNQTLINHEILRQKMKLFSSIIQSCIFILGFSQMLSGQSFHDTKRKY